LFFDKEQTYQLQAVRFDIVDLENNKPEFTRIAMIT
jgi:hypothetical protein